MDKNTHFYDPAQGHGLPHDPFKAIIAPRIIGWISSRSASGKVNLAPYSFFGAFASAPSIIGFSSEGYKDSISNIEETREFVWNMATRPLADQMNVNSAPVPPDVNEFELAGLTEGAGRNVGVPHVVESPAVLECKLLQVQRLRSLEGVEIDNWLVLGQVVGVHLRREYLREGLFDTFGAQPIMRAGYARDYAAIGPKFEIVRPAS
jgi:flavin reductase (DIM6/NTAB) family NADH-FMN oxidoreductase RutF